MIPFINFFDWISNFFLMAYPEKNKATCKTPPEPKIHFIRTHSSKTPHRPLQEGAPLGDMVAKAPSLDAMLSAWSSVQTEFTGFCVFENCNMKP